MATTCIGSVASAYYVLEPSNWTPTANTIMGDVSAGYPTCVKYINGQFVILVNVDPANSAAKRIWAATDPRQDQWTGYVTPATFTRLIDIERFGSYYITVGENSSGQPVAYRSISLSSAFSLLTLANCAKILGVFNMDGKVIIFGKNTSGTVSYWHSTSGITWTQVAIGGSSYSNPIAFGLRTTQEFVYVSDPGTGYLYVRRWNVNTHTDQGGTFITMAGGQTPSGVPIAAWGDLDNGRFQTLTSLAQQFTWNPLQFNNQDWHPNAGITATVTANNHQIPNPNWNVGMHKNGRNVVFGDNAVLRNRVTQAWDGGYQLSGYNDASQTATTAMLDSAVKWGGTYTSAIGTNGLWLAIGFSDATINASKKYNKIVYTDNPIW
jgi:hypothetical protein